MNRAVLAVVWMSVLGLTFALLLALAPGCATSPCPVAGRPCPGPATCETACLHGHMLGCEWATPTPGGHPCVEVCANAAQTVPWNVQALTTAEVCQ